MATTDFAFVPLKAGPRGLTQSHLPAIQHKFGSRTQYGSAQLLCAESCLDMMSVLQCRCSQSLLHSDSQCLPTTMGKVAPAVQGGASLWWPHVSAIYEFARAGQCDVQQAAA